jgi:hypothetical protein
MASKKDPNGSIRDLGRRIVVKLREEVAVPDGGADLGKALDERGLVPWGDLVARFPGLRIAQRFDELKPAELDELTTRAMALDPSYRPPNFSSFLTIGCPADTDPAEVLTRISRWQLVDEAFVDPGPTPPPVTALDDPRSTNQGYLDAAPDGIDAEYAWTRPGGDGFGVGFVDLEQGWTLNHEDLVAAGITIISGVNQAYFGHGTAVLGEVVAVDNTLGGVGIAPRAATRVVSQYRTVTDYDTAEAIISAVRTMDFGDVLLLEAQTTHPAMAGYLPVEVYTDSYEAIRLATALGVVVVEAGGNGGNDLDTLVIGGARILDRSAAGFRDSGAVMVGAASAAAPHTRLGFSNFGSRIDCYGWGDGIDTTGDGWTGNLTTSYTTSFGGTSGASPIVSGAALLIQSINESVHGFRFSPAQVRSVLANPATGTASATPATDRIGVMPNLRSIIDTTLGARVDVYLRDHVGDSGEAHNGPVSASPDIIVRPNPVADPQAAFGAGSGTENDPSLGFVVEAGQPNSIYVRVLNQGALAASNVEATVYWSPVASLVTPALWNLVGTATIPNVPIGEVLTVSDAITWAAADIPATGHYCFVGLIGTPDDPAPSPTDFLDWTNFTSFIANNNNVTWRNFNVVDNVPPPAADPHGYVPLELLLTGAPDRARPFMFDVHAKLPEGARLLIEAPDWLVDRLQLQRCKPERRVSKSAAKRDVSRDSTRDVFVALSPSGRHPLGEVLLPAKAAVPVRLHVHIPEEYRRHDYRIALRQSYKGAEVGRVTWQLTSTGRSG